MCERTDKDVLFDQKIIDGIGDELERLRAENKALKASRDELLEVYKEHRWDMCRLGVDEDLIKKVESQKNGE